MKFLLVSYALVFGRVHSSTIRRYDRIKRCTRWLCSLR